MIFVPFTLQQISNSNLEYAIQIIISNIFSTQQRSYTNTDNLIHAIQFNNNNLLLLSGIDENSLTINEEIIIDNATIRTNEPLNSNSNILIFSQNKLTPETSAQINVFDDINRYQIQINSEGVIDYYKQ